MATFRFTLEYDGTDFEGWQVQAAGHRTVQGCLEEALTRVLGVACHVIGAGRTDAGVHADGQLASASLETRLAAEELHRALNAVLPTDLAVVDLQPAPAGFHARRDAVSKLYRYAVWNGPTRSPRRERSFARVPRRLVLDAMRKAAAPLVGRHDFAAYQASGSSVTTTTRTVWRLDIEGRAGEEIYFWVEGNGFLRHMVRNLVGTLLEVGLGRRSVESPAEVLAGRDRSRAGATAPAPGLTLVEVATGAPSDSEFPDNPRT